MASPPYDVTRIALEGRIDELGRWLSFWTTLVVLGLIFEYGAEIAERVPKNWRPTKSRHFRWIGLWWFIGMLLITGGVAGELRIEVLASRAEGELRDVNNAFSAQLRQDATSASQDASRAKTDAKGAADGAHAALLEANAYKGQITQASRSASTAITMATKAQQEADSFEQKIAKAERDATNAEVHLTEAMQRAREATAELQRLKSPRSLINVDALVSSLGQFKGTEYRLSVFQDAESIAFTRMIENALHRAGWVRKPSPYRLGITSLQVFGSERENAIPVCVATGVQIHFWSDESVEVLNKRPINAHPLALQAAYLLKVDLMATIDPPNERNVDDKITVDTDPEDKFPLMICVGNKP